MAASDKPLEAIADVVIASFAPLFEKLHVRLGDCVQRLGDVDRRLADVEQQLARQREEQS